MLHEVALHCPNTSYTQAQHMKESDVRDLFESREFKAYQEGQQARDKNVVAISERLNLVIQGLNNLGKSIGALFRMSKR